MILLIIALLYLSYLDIKTGLIPDRYTQPLVWLGLFLNVFNDASSLRAAILGAILGYLSLWLLNAVYSVVRKHPGMGGGDFKLTAAIGAWLGVQALPEILCYASFSGLFIAIYRYYRFNATQLPFAPFLAVGTLVKLSLVYFAR